MRSWISMLAPLVGFAALAGAQTAANKPIDFNREIRPILSDQCFQCHGPDDGKRMANLRLDDRASVFAERNGYRIVTPGDPAKSRLFERITTDKRALRMPPASTGRTLSEKQVALIRDWIAQGADWQQHWAYVPPRRPAPPAVRNPKWIRNPIDAFVLARLEKEGLSPTAEADRATLLRRVTFDLTGLPPTPAEIRAFVADKSPNAYEKQVDRLLQSPRYGERMAMHWLDLARYADTHGFHIDSHRDMWPWRDWVIAAFNRNLPFDRFTIEQLAGDLLDNPTRDQLVATGFNRNHMINYEGGAIAEEYQVEYVMDRVDATSTVFLGMTMACARCHDHKYDPIKQKDFYRFYAFFNNTTEEGLDGRRGNAKPLMRLPDERQAAAWTEVEAKLRTLREALNGKRVDAALADWETAALEALPAVSRDMLTAHFEFDGNLNDSSGEYRHGVSLGRAASFGPGPAGGAIHLNAETTLRFGGSVDAVRASQPLSVGVWVRPNTAQTESLKTTMSVASRAVKGRGWEVAVGPGILLPRYRQGSHLIFRIAGELLERTLEVKSRDRVVFVGEWAHFLVTYDGSGKASGVRMYKDGEPLELVADRDGLPEGFSVEGVPLEAGGPGLSERYQGGLDDLRVYGRVLSREEAKSLSDHEAARSLLRIPRGERSGEQQKRLREYFLSWFASDEMKARYRELKQWEQREEDLRYEIPTTMVMDEKPGIRPTYVLGRGDYQNKGEVVTAGVPAVLPPLPAGAPANRLTLARWLVDPAHPLTARVAVNRYWQMYFGTGLVKTAEDFGSQGEPPSHPELLDWLATEFQRGWDIKAMQRLIVTSATYRQSSKVTPSLLEKDRENRLLARGPRFRLPAEMVRDQALFAAGLLVEKQGGPSVASYQPEGLWEEIAFGGPYTAQTYQQDHGEALYRRSMYLFWKRTSPPPVMAIFDAPNREKCVARRPVTNTPLQALALWNDTGLVEAGRAFGQRILREGGASDMDKLRFGFETATGRRPSAKEIQVLASLLKSQRESYGRNPAKAARLLAVGESKADASLPAPEFAAWANVGSVLLSLDETLTRE
jgi:mono/diheme cytochrome c family protein